MKLALLSALVASAMEKDSVVGKGGKMLSFGGTSSIIRLVRVMEKSATCKYRHLRANQAG
eukprot:9677619-Ditylum_brightwellii.AAC.1